MKQKHILRALILANGTPPSRSLLLSERRHADIFLCADGGVNTASRFRVRPDVIIGDLDSALPSSLRAFRTSLQIRVLEQDSTDLEKALRWCVGHWVDEVTVLGANGGRLDHAVGNLGALAKFSRRLSIRFLDDVGEIRFVGKHCRPNLARGTVISLLPLARCSGVVTSGLRWNLRNGTLQLGMRESTSNIVTAKRAIISVKRGDLLLYILRRA
jgi:thiamine pyrophosphokinase